MRGHPSKQPTLSERVKRETVEKKLFRVDGLSQDADAATPRRISGRLGYGR
jgi:hypothetical protein